MVRYGREAFPLSSLVSESEFYRSVFHLAEVVKGKCIKLTYFSSCALSYKTSPVTVSTVSRIKTRGHFMHPRGTNRYSSKCSSELLSSGITSKGRPKTIYNYLIQSSQARVEFTLPHILLAVHKYISPYRPKGGEG